MQIKNSHPIHVLYFETQTSLQELSQFVRVVAHRLYQDAVKNELEITGPIYWIYEGADGQPQTQFSLTIALPVTLDQKKTIVSEFRLKHLESFHCVTTQLYGGWDGMGIAYGNLISHLMSKNLTMNGTNREIYLNMDFQNAEHNITEIQIGIE